MLFLKGSIRVSYGSRQDVGTMPAAFRSDEDLTLMILGLPMAIEATRVQVKKSIITPHHANTRKMLAQQ